MASKITRRELLRLGGLGGIVLLAAACQPKAVVETPKKEVEEVAEAPTKAPEKEWTLLLNLGSRAMPSDPSVPLKEGEKKNIGAQPCADDYMAANPNVKIEWYRRPTGIGGFEWIHARIAAQDCPDVYNFSADNLWPNIGKGWALDITEWGKSPNPYMPGKRAWESYVQDVGRTSQIGPDGGLYGLALDGGGVLMAYNKDMFTELGIEKAPGTWAELMETMHKLKDEGYIGFGDRLPHCCFYHWGYGNIMNQLAYDVILDYDDSGDHFVTSKELVQHTLKGDWPLWDHELKVFQLFKELEPFLPDGYEGMIDPIDLFRKGQVGYKYTNNGRALGYKNDPPPFEVGYAPFPIITKDIWPKSQEKDLRLMGPWGALQPRLPGYLPKTEPDKIPVIIDFCMFLTQPKYVSPICEEVNSVPFVDGCTVPSFLEPWTTPYDRAITLQSWFMVREGAGHTAVDLLTEYMTGRIDDDELMVKAKAAWEDAVQKQLEDNPDWKLD